MTIAIPIILLAIVWRIDSQAAKHMLLTVGLIALVFCGFGIVPMIAVKIVR